MDWMLGREEEGWKETRRWIRAFAGMSAIEKTD
jgi:hypothetical protein